MDQTWPSTLRTCCHVRAPQPLDPQEDVLGATSLVVWTLMLEVLIKYVGVVLRADDHGNGGWVHGSGGGGFCVGKRRHHACARCARRMTVPSAGFCPVYAATACL